MTTVLRRSLRLALMASVLTALLLALVPAAESDARPRCRPAGSRTVALSLRTRVYTLRDATFACLFTRNRSYRIDRPAGDGPVDDGEEVGQVRLNGPFVAYERGRDSGEGGTIATVHVLDLRNGRGRFRDALSVIPESYGETGSSLHRFLLAPDGDIAWTASAGAVREVGALDRRGYRLLESDLEGLRLDVQSLRRSAATITWRSGTTTRSATLR